MSSLAASGDLQVIHRHWLVPAITATATAVAVETMAGDPGVAAVFLDEGQQVIPENELGGAGQARFARGTPPAPGPAPSTVTPWGVTAIRAPECWNTLHVNGSGVVVAHLDTGVDYNHPDLASRIWQNPGEIAGNGVDDDDNGYVDDARGWDFALGNANPMDDSGHGTHTAGTVVGTGVLGTATGVAPGARLMPLKILSGGFGYESDAWAAIEYAVTEGADIITMSLGWIQCYHHPNRAYWRALADEVERSGVLIVAAAGNEGADQSMPWYCAPPTNIRTPGDIPCVLTVGAISSTYAVPSFSSVGPVSWTGIPPYSDYPSPPGLRKPDVAAPGVAITSTLPTSRYSPATWSGTSMACPHVAGAAALVLSANHGLSPAAVRQKLTQTAIDVSLAGPDNYSGAGRIDAYAAVQSAMSSTATPVVGPPSVPETLGPQLATRLFAPAPNPVRGETEIRFMLSDGGAASLDVVDAAGRRVAWIARSTYTAGTHLARWNARDSGGVTVPSGAYWIRLTTAAGIEVRKVLVAR